MIHLSRIILDLEQRAREWEAADTRERELLRTITADHLSIVGEQLFQLSNQVRKGEGI